MDTHFAWSQFGDRTIKQKTQGRKKLQKGKIIGYLLQKEMVCD